MAIPGREEKEFILPLWYPILFCIFSQVFMLLFIVFVVLNHNSVSYGTMMFVLSSLFGGTGFVLMSNRKLAIARQRISVLEKQMETQKQDLALLKEKQ